MDIIILIGMVIGIEYTYKIDGYFWKDQQNSKPISFGNSINKLSDCGSKNPRYYEPYIIGKEFNPNYSRYQSPKVWYGVGIGVNKTVERNSKGVIINE